MHFLHYSSLGVHVFGVFFCCCFFGLFFFGGGDKVGRFLPYTCMHFFTAQFAGLKIYFTGPSDKMSDETDDVEFGSDICPMTFSSVLTWK